jgi:hypothetical protein
MAQAAAPKIAPGFVEVPARALGAETKIPYDVLRYIPEESAEHYRLAPLAIAEGVLEVGMVDPSDIEGIDALNFIARATGMPFKIFKISVADFDRIIKMYGGLTGDVERAVSDLQSTQTITKTDNEAAPLDLDRSAVVPLSENKTIQEDAPTIKIVSTICATRSMDAPPTSTSNRNQTASACAIASTVICTRA